MMTEVPRRRWSAGLSLRARLVGALVGLLAIVCVVIGTATTVAVHQFQLDQLDQQLMSAGIRTNAALHPPGLPERDQNPGPVPPAGQGPGTVTAHYRQGRFDWAKIVNSA